MKRFFCAAAIVLLFSGVSSAENWVFHEVSGMKDGKKTFDFYYDNDSIVKTGNGTILMKGKYVYTDWGREARAKDNPDFPKNCSYSINLREFDCAAKKYRNCRRQYFDSKNVLLDEEITSSSEWEEITEGRMNFIFWKIACGK